MYPAYHQRRGGCFGAGSRYLYVDADGEIHSCPFCQEKAGNCLSEPIEKMIERMKEKGCYKYETVEIL